MIKNFSLFESELKQKELSAEQINFLDTHVKGAWKYNQRTKEVDVRGDFRMSGKAYREGFLGVKFGDVSGDFIAANCLIESLEFAPSKVGGSFICDRNKIESLKGSPREVGGDFDCSSNNLVSLEGAPDKVGGDFICKVNKLKSLQGSPKQVPGSFDCEENRLTTLEGGPEEVGGSFLCVFNKLESLRGAPKQVGGSFLCYENSLETLEGCPEKIMGSFDCSGNKLTNLEGGPKIVKDNFNCSGNPDLISLKGMPEKIGGGLVAGSFEMWDRSNDIKDFISHLPSFKSKGQKLAMTALTPAIINKEIKKSPDKMIKLLAPIWNMEAFSGLKKDLKFPEGLEKTEALINKINRVKNLEI